MEKELFETLEILRIIDQKITSASISIKEFAEEEDNVRDFVKLKKELRLLLEQLRNANFDDVEKLSDKLVHLHLKYSYMIWHFEQIHELIKKLICNIPEEGDV